MAVLLLLAACSKNNSSSGTTSFNGGNTTGQGGSMARFTIVGHYLYTVDGRSLRVFDISNPSLVQLKTVSYSVGILKPSFLSGISCLLPQIPRCIYLISTIPSNRCRKVMFSI
ncbi:MAG: hypothetical protein HWD58_15490 [Bacteroidota bacterium]|nr:MAG: hypothetical protein HWD58_15490 [Bacteroidota bacterium]